MFKVKVVGTYVARSGVMEKEKIKKNYEIEGNIPTLTAALSVVKNKLLGPALAAKYPDYVTFLTYSIVEIAPLDEESKARMDKAEVSFMDREGLLKFIKENALKIDARYYPSLFKLREAVQYAKDDPEGYVKHFAIHEPDLRLDLEMAQCNPGLFPAGPFEAGPEFIGTVKLNSGTAKESPRASSPAVLARKTEERLTGLKADQIRDGEMISLRIWRSIMARAFWSAEQREAARTRGVARQTPEMREWQRQRALLRPHRKHTEASRIKMRIACKASWTSERRQTAGKNIRGEKHYGWKGGRYKNLRGYIFIYSLGHPHCNQRGYIFEHRLVMEKSLGRYLRPEEVVHHINGIKDDNRRENLLLFPDQETHLTHHWEIQTGSL